MSTSRIKLRIDSLNKKIKLEKDRIEKSQKLINVYSKELEELENKTLIDFIKVQNISLEDLKEFMEAKKNERSNTKNEN